MTLGMVLSHQTIMAVREELSNRGHGFSSGHRRVRHGVLPPLPDSARLDAAAMIGLGLIVAGVVVVNAFSKSVAH